MSQESQIDYEIAINHAVIYDLGVAQTLGYIHIGSYDDEMPPIVQTMDGYE